MGRYFKARCSICGRSWMQDYEEPDECPNECENLGIHLRDEEPDEPNEDDDRDEAAEFGGMDIPDTKY